MGEHTRARFGRGGAGLGALAAVTVGLFGVAVPASATDEPAADTTVDQLLVRYEPGADAAAALAAVDPTLTPGEEIGGGLEIVVLDEPLPVDAAEELAARLAASSAVTSAEPDVAVSLPMEPSDVLDLATDVALAPAGGSLRAQAVQTGVLSWGLDRIDQRGASLDGTYRYETTGVGVTAYVIDTGVRATHVELVGRVAPGYGAIGDGYGADDCNGHGTHVAGTVGGSLLGVAKQVTIVPVRVLDCAGDGTSSTVAQGISWVTQHHQPGAPAVAVMSFGGAPGESIPAVDTAVSALVADGVTVVVAAGNDGVSACGTSPARVPEAITVGASARGDGPMDGTNVGPCVDIYAPGDAITSAWPFDGPDATWGPSDSAAGTMSGTSMAAPHVAGIAARLLQTNAALSPAQVWSRLAAEATFAPALDVTRLLYASPLLGVQQPADTGFFLNNSFSATADIQFSYGRPTDEVLVGDWDGDGRDTLAVRRGATFYLSNTLGGGEADVVLTYGRPGDVVLVGDWDGNGTDTFAVRRGAEYHVKNAMSGGPADQVIVYGRPDDAVLVGDWDGTSGDTFAVRRGSQYHIKNSMSGGPADLVLFYGRATDAVLVGDWDGNGTDTLGVRRL